MFIEYEYDGTSILSGEVDLSDGYFAPGSEGRKEINISDFKVWVWVGPYQFDITSVIPPKHLGKLEETFQDYVAEHCMDDLLAPPEYDNDDLEEVG